MFTDRRLVNFVLTASLIPAFMTGSSQTAPEVTKIKSSADLVLVPVVVRKGGSHLAGLKKENFQILQDGKPHDIALFEEVNGAVTPEEQKLQGDLAAGEFGNARYAQEKQRLTVIALDLVNTPSTDQVYLKQELLKFLNEVSETNQQYSLVALTTSGVHVLRDFTSDTKSIAETLKSKDIEATGLNAVGSTGNVLTDQTPCAASDTGCGPSGGGGSNKSSDSQGVAELALWLRLYKTQESFDVFRDWNSRLDTLSTLEQLAQWLAGIPGRKSLIWAGSGIQLYGGMSRFPAANGKMTGSSRQDVNRATEAMDYNSNAFNLLAQANVAVYPLDARHGANTSFAAYDSSRTDAPIGRGAFGGQRGVTANQDQETIAMFEQIADSTGGKACFNRTDLANCLKEFSADSRDYYMLGFYVDKSAKPGWHTINVKLDQRAEVRSRKGFDFEPTRVAQVTFELPLMSPLPYTEVEIRGRFTTTENGSGAGKKRVNFELDLAPKSITFGEQENALNLQIVALVRGIDGKVAATFSQKIDRKLQPQQVDLIRNEGIHYSNRLEVAPGSYGVWFAVRDVNTGHTGSVISKLKVD